MQLLGIGFLISIVISLFIVVFFNKENAYFNSSAAGATGKLMIVDQATGAISFVTKSVKGIDDAFTDSDTTHEGRMAAIEARLDTAEAATALGAISGHTTKIGALEDDINLFKKGNGMGALRGALDNTVRYNDNIALGEDANSYPIVGFKKSNSDGRHATYTSGKGFAQLVVELDDAHTSNMRIVKGSQTAGN